MHLVPVQRHAYPCCRTIPVRASLLSESHHHFLGSIVNKSLPSTPDSVSPYVVIDGQRL
jgi:hypothetical protein